MIHSPRQIPTNVNNALSNPRRKTWKASQALAALTFVLALLQTGALACTGVDMVAADKSVIAGRTMEWALEMEWKIVIIPKGTPLTLDAPPSAGLPAMTVATKYAVAGIGPGVLPVTSLLEGHHSGRSGLFSNHNTCPSGS